MRSRSRPPIVPDASPRASVSPRVFSPLAPSAFFRRLPSLRPERFFLKSQQYFLPIPLCVPGRRCPMVGFFPLFTQVKLPDQMPSDSSRPVDLTSWVVSRLFCMPCLIRVGEGPFVSPRKIPLEEGLEVRPLFTREPCALDRDRSDPGSPFWYKSLSFHP